MRRKKRSGLKTDGPKITGVLWLGCKALTSAQKKVLNDEHEGCSIKQQKDGFDTLDQLKKTVAKYQDSFHVYAGVSPSWLSKAVASGCKVSGIGRARRPWQSPSGRSYSRPPRIQSYKK